MLGLILKTVDDTEEYNGLISALLITVNGSVCIFVLYLIMVGTCDTLFDSIREKFGKGRKKMEKEIEITVEKRINSFFQRQNIELNRDVSSYLKMERDERDVYESRGKIEKITAAFFTELEKAMLDDEIAMQKSMQEGHMIRQFMANSKTKKKMTKIVPSNSLENHEVVNGVLKNHEKANKAKEFWNGGNIK